MLIFNEAFFFIFDVVPLPWGLDRFLPGPLHELLLTIKLLLVGDVVVRHFEEAISAPVRFLLILLGNEVMGELETLQVYTRGVITLDCFQGL